MSSTDDPTAYSGEVSGSDTRGGDSGDYTEELERDIRTQLENLSKDLARRHSQAEGEREYIRDLLEESHKEVVTIRETQESVALPIYGVLGVGIGLTAYGFYTADIVLSISGAGMALIAGLAVLENIKG